MANDVYVAVAGFVQFEPSEREANGKNVRDVVVKPLGKADNDSNVRLTIWPEHDVAVKQGDFVAAEGKFTKSTYQGRDGSQKQSNQLSVKSLVVLSVADRADREVVRSNDTSGDGLF